MKSMRVEESKSVSLGSVGRFQHMYPYKKFMSLLRLARVVSVLVLASDRDINP